MSSNDVRPSPTSNLGVGILKNYLEYARSRRLYQGEVTGREPDSDFEIFVANRLRAHGFKVEPQVGVAGYFIDMAIRHPDNDDYFVLGIECDGATYHSSKSARDRDRLRQEVLENLGWNLYRIWSTDWFNDTEGQVIKLFKHLETVL